MVDPTIATNKKKRVEEEWRTATSKLPAVLSRSDFPPGFIFGTATSAYQVEGGWNEGGKGPSVWDSFSHTKGNILDGSNGDIAVDQYHRYKEDIELMAKLGFDSYRFSISWSRVFPDGLGTKVNEEGIAHYNNVITALLDKGVQPFVTLSHFDLPLYLEESMGGWLNKKVVDHFGIYAETCFANFGDRVKNWITLNEPRQVAIYGYSTGFYPPGKCKQSSPEPYLVAHHQLLAHAKAVSIYRKKFQDQQGGQIGLVVDCEWGEPLTDKTQDINAAARNLDFQLGWFLDPIYFGDYPESMRERVGNNLPEFSLQEKELLRASVDFIGLNHYSSRFIVDQTRREEYEYDNAQGVEKIAEWGSGEMIGEKGTSSWLYVVPWGMRKVLNYVAQKYNNPPIYVTENGMDDEDHAGLPLNKILEDKLRVKYYEGYLASVGQAIKEGADVRGYMAWSFLDNFEWNFGYTLRFGLVYVDYQNGLSRHPKSSAYWFSRLLRGGREEKKSGKDEKYRLLFPPVVSMSSAFWRFSCLLKGGEEKIGKEEDYPLPSPVIISRIFLFLIFYIILFCFLFF